MQKSSCTRCEKPASTVCAGCKSSPSYAVTPELVSVTYCTKDCQVADWPVHKLLCKASSTRRSLFRAASTIQDAFLIYREVVFDKLFTKVEEKNGLLLLTEGLYAQDDIFVPFPETLAKTKLDRQAILTHLTCTDALGWMHNFIGISAQLEEYAVKGKNYRRSTVVVSPRGPDFNDSRDYEHDLLKITLPDGQAYALDTTSAQYGYYKPIVPWDDFFRWRVEYVLTIRPFGACRLVFQQELDKNVRAKEKIHGNPLAVGLDTGIFYLNNEFSMRLDRSSDEWLKREGLKDFSTVLKLTQETFEEKKKDLLLHIEKELKSYRDHYVRGGRLGRKFGKAAASLPRLNKGENF
ncbi:hypothetical protein MMC11_002093 [Xylographa trunciseda]|nr:hypothetical protein [Xylographa trunciseda]